MRVLLVEDDFDVRTMIEWALTPRNGFDVVASVATADEAVGLLEGGIGVDVVVSDFMLQGSSLNGLDLCRAATRQFGIPSVLISAVPHLLKNEDGTPKVLPFLTKPFGPDDLRAAIHTAFGMEADTENAP